MIRLAFLLALLAPCAMADTVVAIRTIAANHIIGPDDLALRDGTVLGGESDPGLFIGMEARVALYAGRPIKVGDVRAPAIVERNALLRLVFQNGGIVIQTEGRSLGRGAPGETIRVMNLSSRTTVMAVIGNDGVAYVGG